MTWSERMFERLRDLELGHDQIVSVIDILVEVRETADYAGYKRGMRAAIEQEDVSPAESKMKTTKKTSARWENLPRCPSTPFVCLCPVCRSWG